MYPHRPYDQEQPDPNPDDDLPVLTPQQQAELERDVARLIGDDPPPPLVRRDALGVYSRAVVHEAATTPAPWLGVAICAFVCAVTFVVAAAVLRGVYAP